MSQPQQNAFYFGNRLAQNGPPPPLPTVTEWALMVMGLLTMAAGTIVLGRSFLRAATPR